MAAVPTYDAATVGAYTPTKAESFFIEDYIAGATIEPGQGLALNTSGKAVLARANSVTTSKFIGLALTKAVANRPVAVLWIGRVNFFDVSALNVGTLIYISSSTAGGLVDTAPTGTGNVVCPIGFVDALHDSVTPTRVLRLFADPLYSPVALS